MEHSFTLEDIKKNLRNFFHIDSSWTIKLSQEAKKPRTQEDETVDWTSLYRHQENPYTITNYKIPEGMLNLVH